MATAIKLNTLFETFVKFCSHQKVTSTDNGDIVKIESQEMCIHFG